MSHTHILPVALLVFSTAILPIAGHAQRLAERQVTSAQRVDGGPMLSAPAPLPGDTPLVPAMGKQERPQIARGAETSLVVWADTRAALAGNSTISVGGAGPYFGTGLGTMNDIYAARLDQNGNVIDSHPIIISQASYSQNYPHVAWNGQNWLVAWVEELETNPYAYQIRATRISPAGAVLDATPMVVAGGQFGDFPTGISFDGTNWVIVWDGVSPSGTERSIYAARVSPAGAVLDPGGLVIYNHPTQFLANADLAWNGSGFLLTFRDLFDQKIYGLRLNQALQPVGARFTINNFSPSRPTHVQVASNGDGYFVAWDEHPASGNIGSLYGARVSSTGQVLDPSGIVIAANVGTSETFPDVVWNGTSWSVAYDSGYDEASGDYSNHNIYLKRVSSAGAVLTASPVVVSAAFNHQLSPAIALGFNGAVQIVWHDLRAEEDVYTAQVSSAGAVSNERAVGLGAPRQSRPRMAPGDNIFFTVFQRQIAGVAHVYGQRLDSSGNALDAEPFQITDSAIHTNANPSVAFNGTHFLVVWDQLFVDEFGNLIRHVYGRRIGSNGVFADATPFFIMTGLTPDVAALGDTFLTVAIRRIGQQWRYVEAVRVSGSGAVLGEQVLVGSGYNHVPRVVAFGTRWLAVWEYHSRHDVSRSWIRGSFIEADGVPATDFQVAVSDSQFGTGNSFDDTPHLAVSGAEALIVWADNDVDQLNDIKGRRIAADGTLLGSNFGFRICDASGSQYLPAVAWDGANYVVTWIDQRDEQFPVQPRGNIYGARVRPDETLLDGSGFPIANTAAPEETPFVASANGTTVFAYSAFYAQAPYTAMRVTTRSMHSSVTTGVTAVSRKLHGSFSGDIPLPLTGTLGIEPRFAGNSGDHQIIVSFPASVTVSEAQITAGVGTVASMTVAGSQVTVNLTNVANAQRITLTLVGVNGSGNVAIPMGVLVGDTNRNGFVNSSDVGQTKATSGQTVDGTNFFADVTVSGAINASDLGMVKAHSGSMLP